MKTWLNNAVLFLTALFIHNFQCAYSQDLNYVLDSMVVSAKKSGLSVKDNVITYKISEDSLAALETVRALVSSMPLVTYEQIEGKLKVNGNENVLILLNGQRSLVFNKSNFSYIAEFLHGKEIESISIDISPTGRYSDYSAVINITSRNVLSNFYSGTLSASASSKYILTPSAAITVSFGKLTTNAKYSYERSDIRPSWNYTESRNAGGSSAGLYLASDTTSKRCSNDHDVELSLSYDFTPSDILFVSSAGSFSAVKSIINSFSEIGGIRNSFRNTTKNGNNRNTGSFAYQHYFDKKNQKILTLQYSLDNRISNNKYGATSRENKSTNRQHTVAAEYFHTIDKSANWNLNLIWFSRKYGSNSSENVLLDHIQNVLQTSLNASKRLGKFLLTVQTAYDYTSDRADFNNATSHMKDNYGAIRYRSAVQWFPLSGHTVRLSASRNIYRPDISVRNPYRDESVAGMVSQGNPQLSNQKNFHLILSYMYMKGAKLSFNFLVSYLSSADGVFATTRVLEDGRLFRSYENGIEDKNFSLCPSFMWSPNQNLMINMSYRIGWKWFGGPDKTHSFIDHTAYINATYKPWRGGELLLNASLLNPSIMSVVSTQSTRIHYVVNGFVLMTQHFGKSWVVGISINQPWYRRSNIILDYETNGHRFYSKSSEPGQVIKATVRYNFGRFRSGVKRNSRVVIDSDRIQ